jgi:hypothetical protein
MYEIINTFNIVSYKMIRLNPHVSRLFNVCINYHDRSLILVFIKIHDNNIIIDVI